MLRFASTTTTRTRTATPVVAVASWSSISAVSAGSVSANPATPQNVTQNAMPMSQKPQAQLYPSYFKPCFSALSFNTTEITENSIHLNLDNTDRIEAHNEPYPQPGEVTP